MMGLGGKLQGLRPPPLALIAILLSIAVGLSNLHLSITAFDNLADSWPLITGPPHPGMDLSSLNQRFVRSLVGLVVMGALALLMMKSALALLQQRRNAFLKGTILASASLLFSLVLFSPSIASQAARVALVGATVVFHILPSNIAYFRQHNHLHYHQRPKGFHRQGRKWDPWHHHPHDHPHRAGRGHHHPRPEKGD